MAILKGLVGDDPPTLHHILSVYLRTSRDLIAALRAADPSGSEI